MKVIQVLPALNSGGVERGTIDLARALVQAGHESIVISSGGILVSKLVSEGSQHIEMPVHRKSLLSLRQVASLRRLFAELQPDIVHVRSRVPAWLSYFAWKKMPQASRPKLVSTAHGLYSVNAYSAIMARGEQVIAISQCVKDYLTTNYSKHLRAEPVIVYRGVDITEFNRKVSLPSEWRGSIEAEFPNLQNKRLLLMPGRITRWKGQEDFIRLIADLAKRDSCVQGVIVGGAEKNKQHFEVELQNLAEELGVQERVTFVGRRNDIKYWYKASAIVFNLSNRPEPFGRTIIEAVAVGTPVIGYDIGGPAESLQACYPQGLVKNGDLAALAEKTRKLLRVPGEPQLRPDFTLECLASKTIQVYSGLI